MNKIITWLIIHVFIFEYEIIQQKFGIKHIKKYIYYNSDFNYFKIYHTNDHFDGLTE